MEVSYNPAMPGASVSRSGKRLAVGSTVIPRSESNGIHGHVLHSIDCGGPATHSLKVGGYVTAFKHPVRTSQETHSVSITTANRLTLFGEMIDVYCENHMEHTPTLCGRNSVF
jgi:hypothetical protein